MSEFVRLHSEDPLVLEEGPCPLPQAHEGISGFHYLSEEEVRDHGWIPYVREELPAFDEQTQELVSSPVMKEGRVHLVHEVVALPVAVLEARLDAIRKTRLAQLAHNRWEREVGGFYWEGVHLHTDRESVLAMALAAQGEREKRWKDKDGQWHSLSVDRLREAMDAIEQFKDRCFQKEEELNQQLIAAETVTALDLVDIAGPWKGDI